MKILHEAAKLRELLPLALTSFLVGCTTFHPVETTPEEILRSIAPGDTVRINTRDGGELTMLVLSVSGFQVRGRTKGTPSEVLQVGLERIDTIDVERLNLRKAILTTFVPAVIAAIIICNNQDCETRSIVTATFGP